MSGIDRPYTIPYGFVVLLGSVSLALAKESADAFLHVEEQVDERTKDLGNALTQLRALEKMKERFFSNISHDFKTPITVALGSIEKTKKQIETASLEPAERSLYQLLGMIKDLLDTVKAESGTLKMTWETAKPAELLREWIQPYDLLCKNKGISLQLDVERVSALKIPVDVSKLRRVIDNLLSNAVKFTNKTNSSEAVVRVDIKTDNARCYIEISDSGIGIPEDEREKIFDRFFQSSRTSLKDHGGSGIGLSFAKEMMDLHNGKIWVEKSNFGGSKFVMALPLSQDVEVTGEHEVTSPEGEAMFHGSLDVAYPPEKPKSSDVTKPTILLAEDNPEVAQIVVDALSAEYNVHFAPDGLKAFERLQAENFDGVVTDIVMPRMTGDELTIKLRAEAKTRSLPIIVLSSQSDQARIAKVLRSGANDYVTKPFTSEILCARVRSQIEAHKTADWIAQNEKVIELGYLAGGMAHQIKNGMNHLRGQVDYYLNATDSLLEQATGMSEEDRKAFQVKLQKSKEIVQRALARIEMLTKSVDVYSSGSTQLTELKAADSVELALTLHGDAIKMKSVQVKTEGLTGIRFMGYSMFHEAMVNLIGNAIGTVKADGSGRITITGHETDQDVSISIQDNGAGIAPEVLPRLCRPFFTTKAPGEGTGMGLFVTRDVIEGHHRGKLTIESPGEGLGATFTVHVPKVAPAQGEGSAVKIHGVRVS